MKLTCIIPGILIMAGINAQAQEQKINPIRMDHFMDNHAWFTSANAAGLSADNRLEFSELYIGTRLKNGDFHRVQESCKSAHYLFSAQGGIAIGDVYLQGGFNFKQAFDDGVKFASILDPYRGNPYQIADSTGGNWRKQQYDMYVKAVSPIWFNLFAIGLELDLAVGRGAKKIDPRPQANSNKLDINPSFAFYMGKHTAGGVFHYQRFREDIDLMLYNSSELQKLYLLRGMGQYFFETFNATQRERMYQGNGKGGSLQYSYQNNRFSVFVSGKYMTYKEDVDDIDRERSRPKNIGQVNDKELTGNIRLSLSGKKIVHKLEAGYSSVEQNGTEIGQRFEQTDYVTISKAPDRSICKIDRITGSYHLNILKERDVYNWTFGVNGMYEDYNDSYNVANSFLRYSRMLGRASINKNFQINEKQILQTGLSGYYCYVKDHSVSYHRLNEAEDEGDQTIYTGLILPDYNYFMQDNYGGGIIVKYSFQLPKTQWFNVGADINLHYSKQKDMRSEFLFRIGYLF